MHFYKFFCNNGFVVVVVRWMFLLLNLSSFSCSVSCFWKISSLCLLLLLCLVFIIVVRMFVITLHVKRQMYLTQC